MVKRSRGLIDYKRFAKDQIKGGRKTQPVYMDGTLYAAGDEVLEGVVYYARPFKPDWGEDDTTDTWRLIVAPRDGTNSIVIRPSETRAVRNSND